MSRYENRPARAGRRVQGDNEMFTIEARSPVVDLSFLLDAIDASECLWRVLPAPVPLFIEEVHRGLCEAVGVFDGN
jgi:hypothetical protein